MGGSRDLLARLRDAESAGDIATERRICYDLGVIHQRKHKYAKAIEFYERHLALLDGRDASVGMVHRNIGDCYHDLGNAREALRYQRLFRDFAIAAGSKVDEQRALISIGNALLEAVSAGDFAVEFEGDAEHDKENVSPDADVALAKGRISPAFSSVADAAARKAKAVDAMLSAYTRAHRLALEIEASAAVSRAESAEMLSGVHMNLGNAYEVKGDLERALAHAQESLRIARAGGDKEGELRAGQLVGSVCVSLGKTTDAVLALKDAIRAAKSLQEKAAEAELLNQLGVAHMAAHQHELAVTSFQQSLRLMEETASEDGLQRARENLAAARRYVRAKRRADAAEKELAGVGKELARVDAQRENGDFDGQRRSQLVNRVADLTETAADKRAAAEQGALAVAHYARLARLLEDEAGVVTGGRRRLAEILFSLGVTCAEIGEPTRAREAFGQAAAHYDEGSTDRAEALWRYADALERADSSADGVATAFVECADCAALATEPRLEYHARSKAATWLSVCGAVADAQRQRARADELYSALGGDVEFGVDDREGPGGAESESGESGSEGAGDDDDEGAIEAAEIAMEAAAGRRTRRGGANTKAARRRNEKGETPLHVAAMNGNLASARRLLAAGAEIDARDNAGWTPLHDACNSGQIEMIRLLVENGADLFAKGYDEETPLHDACRFAQKEVVALLLELNAPLDAKNVNGETPLQVAGSYTIVRMLCEKAGVPAPSKDEWRAQQKGGRTNDETDNRLADTIATTAREGRSSRGEDRRRSRSSLEGDFAADADNDDRSVSSKRRRVARNDGGGMRTQRGPRLSRLKPAVRRQHAGSSHASQSQSQSQQSHSRSPSPMDWGAADALDDVRSPAGGDYDFGGPMLEDAARVHAPPAIERQRSLVSVHAQPTAHNAHAAVPAVPPPAPVLRVGVEFRNYDFRCFVPIPLGGGGPPPTVEWLLGVALERCREIKGEDIDVSDVTIGQYSVSLGDAVQAVLQNPSEVVVVHVRGIRKRPLHETYAARCRHAHAHVSGVARGGEGVTHAAMGLRPIPAVLGAFSAAHSAHGASIASISLDHVVLSGPSVAAPVFQALRTATSLVQLSLRAACIGDAEAAVLADDLLRYLPSLQALDLGDNCMGAAGFDRVCRAFPPSTGRSLRLSHNPLVGCDVASWASANALSAALRAGGVNAGDLAGNPTRGSVVPARSVAALLESAANLEELRLDGCNLGPSFFADASLQTALERHAVSLRVLHIGDNDVCGAFELPTPARSTDGGVSFSNAMRRIAACPGRRLVDLDLRSAPLTPAAVSALADLVVTRGEALALSLADCALADVESCAAVARLLRQGSLRALDMYCAGVNSASAAAFARELLLADALTLAQVERVSLRGNVDMGRDGALAVAAALLALPSISRIDLSACALGGPCVGDVIVCALGRTGRLGGSVDLDLSDNIAIDDTPALDEHVRDHPMDGSKGSYGEHGGGSAPDVTAVTAAHRATTGASLSMAEYEDEPIFDFDGDSGAYAQTYLEERDAPTESPCVLGASSPPPMFRAQQDAAAVAEAISAWGRQHGRQGSVRCLRLGRVGDLGGDGALLLVRAWRGVCCPHVRHLALDDPSAALVLEAPLACCPHGAPADAEMSQSVSFEG